MSGDTFRVCYSREVEGGGFKKGGDGVGNWSDLFLVYVSILLKKYTTNALEIDLDLGLTRKYSVSSSKVSWSSGSIWPCN